MKRLALEELGNTEREKAWKWLSMCNRKDGGFTKREEEAYKAGHEEGWNKLLSILTEKRIIQEETPDA